MGAAGAGTRNIRPGSFNDRLAIGSIAYCFVKWNHPTAVKLGYGDGEKANLPSHHLQWLTRGVDLFVGYVDLRYSCSFEELADLS